MSGALPPSWTGTTPAQRPATPAAGDFNLDAPDVRRIRIPLDAAAVTPGREIPMTGNFLWAVRASSPSAEVIARVNHPWGDGIPVSEGLMVRTPNYQRVYFEHTAQAGEWIEILYFVSGIDFAVANPGAIVSTISVAKPTGGENTTLALVADTNTQVVAADATRRAVIIANEGAANVRVAWNPSTTPLSATVGVLLAPGASITIEGTKRVDARAIGAAANINAMTILD